MNTNPTSDIVTERVNDISIIVNLNDTDECC